jgi:c(7)-type cytochrome triheme protein
MTTLGMTIRVRLLKRGLLTALLITLATLVLLGWMLSHSVAAKLNRGSALSIANENQNPTRDYSQFKHDNPQHARLPCLLCHRRENNSARPTLPGKSGHAPCAGCHGQQFSNSNSNSPICTICHTNTQAGTVKTFPPLLSFNVKFDHARHSAVGATCAVCHRRNRGGLAFSIPAGLNAHTTCFGCHTPQAEANGRKISSCSTCHGPGRLVRTTERAAAFRIGFSHAKHDASEKLKCTDCHRVRPGWPQGRQVMSPIALNHHAPAQTPSCMTCHNGKKAFGGDDFSACTRCHKGPEWHF